jgi:predicted Zn finger-like uncharacterized protein
VDVHCERCGTSYSLDESRLGEGGARVRCARCGHVFLVPKSEVKPKASPESPPTVAPPPAGAEPRRREWRVRQRDGSLASLRELTTLQRWIVEGKLAREDEVGLDGENWRRLGSISDLETFFAASDARARVAALEEELARLKPQTALPPPEDVPTSPAVVVRPAEVPAAAPAPKTVQPQSPRAAAASALASPPVPQAPLPKGVPEGSDIPQEPAFTQTAGGLGLVPTDDWEPPKLRRGAGGKVVVVLLLLGAVAAAAWWGYFRIWLPENVRAREEQARNSRLEREQADREASARAAELRAKDELLASLATAGSRDGGAPALVDAGPVPRGELEAPAPGRGMAPLDTSVPAPTLVAAPEPKGQEAPPADGQESPAAGTQGLASAPHGTPQTFEEWMAEGNRRRTHERAAAALAAYDRALALKPQSSDVHADRGLALLDLGRRAEALTEFQRALELNPKDGVAVLGLAEAYRSLGRSEEARRAYQRYLNGWPAGAEVHAARAALESLKE